MNDIETYLEHVRISLDKAGFQRCCVGRKNVHDVTAEETASFEAVLENATDERPVQQYLTEHPWMLVGELGGGCRWVIPEKRLGSHFRTS